MTSLYIQFDLICFLKTSNEYLVYKLLVKSEFYIACEKYNLDPIEYTSDQ